MPAASRAFRNDLVNRAARRRTATERREIVRVQMSNSSRPILWMVKSYELHAPNSSGSLFVIVLIMMVTARAPLVMAADVAIMVISVILMGEVVLQVFLPLGNTSAPPVHFRLFIRSGSITPTAKIVAQFLPVIMEPFIAVLGGLSFVLVANYQTCHNKKLPSTCGKAGDRAILRKRRRTYGGTFCPR